MEELSNRCPDEIIFNGRVPQQMFRLDNLKRQISSIHKFSNRISSSASLLLWLLIRDLLYLSSFHFVQIFFKSPLLKIGCLTFCLWPQDLVSLTLGSGLYWPLGRVSSDPRVGSFDLRAWSLLTPGPSLSWPQGQISVYFVIDCILYTYLSNRYYSTFSNFGLDFNDSYLLLEFFLTCSIFFHTIASLVNCKLCETVLDVWFSPERKRQASLETLDHGLTFPWLPKGRETLDFWK